MNSLFSVTKRVQSFQEIGSKTSECQIWDLISASERRSTVGRRASSYESQEAAKCPVWLLLVGIWNPHSHSNSVESYTCGVTYLLGKAFRATCFFHVQSW